MWRVIILVSNLSYRSIQQSFECTYNKFVMSQIQVSAAVRKTTRGLLVNFWFRPSPSQKQPKHNHYWYNPSQFDNACKVKVQIHFPLLQASDGVHGSHGLVCLYIEAARIAQPRGRHEYRRISQGRTKGSHVLSQRNSQVDKGGLF